MAATLGDAVLFLRANSDGLNKGLNEAEGKTKSWAGNLGGVVKAGLLGAAGVAAGAVVGLAGGLALAVKDGLALNATFENTKAQLLAFTKDGAKAEQILADIREEAAKTPFAFQEMASATASLLPAAKASGVELMDLVKQAEILAASNPAQGLEGAAVALKEALSGDFVSIIERFNLPRQRLNELKKEGVPALEAVQIAMSELGLDMDLVSNLAQTSDGRWSTFWDTIDGIKSTLSQPLFDLIKEGLISVQGLLDANLPQLEAFASMLGERIAGAARWAVESIGTLTKWWQENFTAIGSSTDGITAKIKAFFEERFGFILDWVQENMPLIKQTIQTILTAIQTFWAKHGDTIMTVVQRTFDAVMLVVDTILKSVLGIIRAVMLAINGDWEGAWNEVANVVGRILSTILTVVGNQMLSMVQLIVSIGPSLIGAGRALIENMWIGMSTGFTVLFSRARAKLQELRNLLPFSEPRDSTSPLRGLAKSGEAIVGQIQQGLDRASLNLNGMLSTPTAAGATYGNMTVNVYGATDPTSTARAVDNVLNTRRRRGI